MTDTHIYQPKPDHHYRAETPNIVLELGLSLPAVGLYTYLKKVAGDGGACWKSQTLICKEIGVAPATYIKYRDELESKHDLLGGKSLINVQTRKKPDGSNDTTTISIVDVWRENGDYFRSKKKLCHSESERPPIQYLNEGHSISECKEEHSKKNPIKKDNVSTLPSSMQKKKASPDRYINSLNPEQKKLHDSLIKHRPDWGQPLKSEDVCAWFLAKKYTIQQVTDAFLVYRQDAAEAKSKGRVLRDMGAYVVGAIKNKRIPKNPSFEANKQMAISSLANQENMKAMDKYVSYQLGAHEDQIPYSLPMSQFTSMLEDIKRKINHQQECYA